MLALTNNTIALTSKYNKYDDAFVFGSGVLSSEQCEFKVQLTKIDKHIAVGVIDEQYKHKQ